jgi:hypothetical protein
MQTDGQMDAQAEGHMADRQTDKQMIVCIFVMVVLSIFSLKFTEKWPTDRQTDR